MSALQQMILDEMIARAVEPPRGKPVDTELVRVRGAIGRAIVDFCRSRVGHTFHVGDLRENVEAVIGTIAPDSPGRILRELRRDGIVVYEVVSRADSLYRVLEVRS